MEYTEKKPTQWKDLHFEHDNWNRELRFWKEEIHSFENRLEEIASEWTDKHVLAQLEHFQNQYIRHKEVIDTLLHDINVHEDTLEKLKGQYDETEDNSFKDHKFMRGRMFTQRKLYNELKNDFFRYLEKLF
jgi:chromosome segregation ATPase